MSKIPVLRPLLPSADILLPYLRRIDRNRIYTNYGPLSTELGQKLANYFQVGAENVVCANSGTSAITAAILARVGRATKEKPLAIVPSFTFVATALAAEACGYEVVLHDVSADSWGLDSKHLDRYKNLSKVGVVIPVAPFGRPVRQDQWRKFEEDTGVPVVIDGAACFETVKETPSDFLGQIPVAMSFHATKTFSTGEGGCILTTDGALASRVQQCLNFGFVDSRECAFPSINGKMSEYHAAIGLANLDTWSQKVAAMARVNDCYREELSGFGIGNSLVSSPDICSSYVLYLARNMEETDKVKAVLSENDIGFRHWYGPNLQRQKHFSRMKKEQFPVADTLQKIVIGLPVAPDLSKENIQMICNLLGRII